jgi:hypothetical protein
MPRWVIIGRNNKSQHFGINASWFRIVGRFFVLAIENSEQIPS